MKKISILLIAIISIVACKPEHPKDFITISGKLENNTDSIINILGKNRFAKKIKINEDGSFKDTLKIKEQDIYTFQTNFSRRAPIYLKNGFDLHLTGDSEKFMDSFVYTGTGAVNTNFILAQLAFNKSIGNPMNFFLLEKEDFDQRVAGFRKGLDSILEKYNGIDTALVSEAVKQNNSVSDYFKNNYVAQHESAKLKAEALEKTAKGKASPKFEDYINYKGGKKSLASFKGKYVYIDLWATWCKPCIVEIPSLQKLEKKYHSKNIEFVSISTDESRRSGGSWEAAEKKWRDFVKARNLTGTQLWSGKDFSFQKAYSVTSIPRFILIDPNGNIIDSNAPRPSNPKLVALFTELGI
jgi:thiol-disulfide isomerase/thioredoxin